MEYRAYANLDNYLEKRTYNGRPNTLQAYRLIANLVDESGLTADTLYSHSFLVFEDGTAGTIRSVVMDFRKELKELLMSGKPAIALSRLEKAHDFNKAEFRMGGYTLTRELEYYEFLKGLKVTFTAMGYGQGEQD